MKPRRRTVAAFFLVLAAGLVFIATAGADYRGTDMWSNLMPESSHDGLADRHPISYYQLDYYVDAGITNTDGIPAQIAQFFASAFHFVVVMTMRLAISIYDWAFHLDLITGDRGGLAAATPVVQQTYHDIVLPFLEVAVICFGVWIAVKTYQRNAHEVWSAIGRVVLMSVLSIAIIQHTPETIGRAYQMSDDLAMKIVSGMSNGDPADRVFDAFVYRPWAILQFGGLQVCTGSERDSDGFPLASTSPSTRSVCHSVLKKDADGHGDYARIMLRYAPGSKDRKAYYDALREGKAFAGAPTMEIDRTDAPAVDMMQAGGALQRLFYVALVGLCTVGGILLLGLICVGVIFAQIALVLLFVLTPFMLLFATYPGTHHVFRKWAGWLGKVLVGKVFYAIMLGATISTSVALLTTGAIYGYFVAFLLQSVLYFGVFIKRKKILEMVTSSKTAEHYSQGESKTASFVGAAAMVATAAATDGASTFASTMRQGWQGHSSSSSSSSGQATPPTAPDVDTPDTQTVPPAEAPQQQPQQAPVSSTSDVPETMPDDASTPAPQRQEATVPRPFSEDLAAAQQRQNQPPDPPDYPDPPDEPEDVDQSPARFQPASTWRTPENLTREQLTGPRPLRTFEEELELATLAQERPVEERVSKTWDD